MLISEMLFEGKELLKRIQKIAINEERSSSCQFGFPLILMESCEFYIIGIWMYMSILTLYSRYSRYINPLVDF